MTFVEKVWWSAVVGVVLSLETLHLYACTYVGDDGLPSFIGMSMVFWCCAKVARSVDNMAITAGVASAVWALASAALWWRMGRGLDLDEEARGYLGAWTCAAALALALPAARSSIPPRGPGATFVGSLVAGVLSITIAFVVRAMWLGAPQSELVNVQKVFFGAALPALVGLIYVATNPFRWILRVDPHGAIRLPLGSPPRRMWWRRRNFRGSGRLHPDLAGLADGRRGRADHRRRGRRARDG